MIAVLALGLGLLILEPGFGSALGIFCGLGFVGGSMMPVYGALVARLFGPESFGQVMGLGALVGLPVLFIGPLGFGYAFDSTQSYGIGLFGLIVALGLGACLLAFLPAGSAAREAR